MNCYRCGNELTTGDAPGHGECNQCRNVYQMSDNLTVGRVAFGPRKCECGAWDDFGVVYEGSTPTVDRKATMRRILRICDAAPTLTDGQGKRGDLALALAALDSIAAIAHEVLAGGE